MSKTVKSARTYTFKYGGDLEYIDLNTLLVSQIHFSTILNEIKSSVAPESNLSIKLKPLSKGSVPLELMLDLSWVEALFKKENIELFESITTILVSLIALKQLLKGNKPISVKVKDDKVTVKTGDTKIEIDRRAYQIYSENVIVNEALIKGFEAIDRDEEIEDIEFTEVGESVPLFKIPRKDFEGMKQSNSLIEEEQREDKRFSVNVRVFKVVFDKGYKWQFYLEGRKISANVEDEYFMKEVNDGVESFRKGDILNVDMKINKVYDKGINDYIDKSYTIVKVNKHTPRSEQTNMFNNGE